MKPGKKPFLTKICPVCQIDKPRSDYYKKGDTISHKCKPCSRADMNLSAPKYFGKYLEKQNQWRRDKYQNDLAYREKIAAQKKSRYILICNMENAKRRERWKTDPFCPARKYYRRKDVKDRTPKWVNLEEILQIYAQCPVGYHVDHIVPLKGLINNRPVTGLHVPWNLQYLTPQENQRKHCRITDDYLLQFS
jgi:hypothetical protein